LRENIGFRFGLLILSFVFLSSCNLPLQNVPGVTEVPLPTKTAPPIQTNIPPTSTPEAFVALDPVKVALDFVAQSCNAVWSNNAFYLPCPGHLDEMEQGYVESSDHGVAEGMISVSAPLISMLPGQGDGNGSGLFGRYPALLIYPGDRFRTILACQGDSPCNAEFALEYYDQEGTYVDTNWSWMHMEGDGLIEISADISSLAGQTIELMLVMREKDSADNNWFMLIQPHIERDPDAQPPPTVAPTSTPELVDQTPGVISGIVDMSTAPPYLTDPMNTEGGTPVVVTFFNLDNGTYWYVQTSLTGHPYYQMTVSPGTYQVVAYARGVGGEPYVVAGYTGKNPSCGQALQEVKVDQNERVENIVIADWNWTCGGTAYRPEKPGQVPIP